MKFDIRVFRIYIYMLLSTFVTLSNGRQKIDANVNPRRL